MTTNLHTAQELLFGKGGLGVSNIKLFPGSNRDATPEQIAAEVARILGDFMGDQNLAPVEKA